MAMDKKIWIGLSRILEAILFIMGIWSLYREDWLWVFGCFFGFSLAMIPILIKRNFKFSVHWLIELLLVFAISLHIWGGTLNLYSIPYYDTIAHFIASLIIAFFALIVVYILDVFSPRVHMDMLMLAFFIIIFTIAMGALWEIAEFVYDYAVYSGEPIRLPGERLREIYAICIKRMTAYTQLSCSRYTRGKKGKTRGES